MDKIKKYQKAILSILKEYAKIEYANVGGKNYLVADKENHHYQIMTIGWQGVKFVHDCPMHFDVINNKIWVQQNMTEWDIGKMLEEQGVTKQEIVVGFLTPFLRETTGYAIA